jgi:hypothetical protein
MAMNNLNPAWSNEVLHSMAQNECLLLKQFVQKRHRSSHGVVAFKDIKHFVSKGVETSVAWDSVLLDCHTRGTSEPEHWDADYWLDATPKQGLSYVMLDRKLTILSGLRQTALARYALHFKNSNTLYGVKLSRWVVDYGMYHTWQALVEICASNYPQFELAPLRHKERETQQGKWIEEEYSLALNRIDRSTGECVVLSRQDASNWLGELLRCAR